MPNFGSIHLLSTIHPTMIASKIQTLSMIPSNFSCLTYVPVAPITYCGFPIANKADIKSSCNENKISIPLILSIHHNG